MVTIHILQYLSDAKVLAVEVGGTAAFIVFVVIQTKNAIRHIILEGRKDK
jgi:hypothetical protein